MDLGFLCKLYFTSGTVVALGGSLIPSFKTDIMNYGSRKIETNAAQRSVSPSLLKRLYYLTASMQVPHSWFLHYYVVSVASSLFWGLQIFQHGKLLQFLLPYSGSVDVFMSINQVFLAWLLVFTQGSRRLIESLTLARPTKATMWFGLWILGALFYVFIGIAIWLQGTPAIDKDESFADIELTMPSIKTAIAIPLFLIASSIQHICHKHLANLKKYSLPQHWLFRLVVCPHYTCECLIYLAVAIISAPDGKSLNSMVASGLLFVASNLAVTADSTHQWYVDKFGAEVVGSRWRMVPYVY